MVDGDARTGPSGQDPSRPFHRIKGQLWVNDKLIDSGDKGVTFLTFREGPLAVLELLRSSTNIIAAGISQHILHRL